MPHTTAMRRLGIHGEAETRRLQRKWKVQGEAYLGAARERRQEMADAPSVFTQIVEAVTTVRDAWAPIPSVIAQLQSAFNGPDMRQKFEQLRASQKVRLFKQYASMLRVQRLNGFRRW
ncbi:hypothetical protein AA309_19185 [Microvirga vignae]|uniref:Uncharacterized protein n=1 Tax=Microvirga vignae TaxID=1225564 RepID=A0A0H1R8M4_9HYPH|nr:hypothetical protein AA309_19185 [Microvirga vignae]